MQPAVLRSFERRSFFGYSSRSGYLRSEAIDSFVAIFHFISFFFWNIFRSFYIYFWLFRDFCSARYEFHSSFLHAIDPIRDPRYRLFLPETTRDYMKA